jgi:aspartyl-tRNA(Asn)/glutamyl-tRNA(Gln) amidotransferase subunit B
MKSNWEIVIGLEIHVQLNTESKIFSGSSTGYGAKPNSQASIIDLGYPGVLPVLNQSVIEKAIKFGLATDAKISRKTIFSRKNYFYPDLPKGYQISQLELPIVQEGYVEINFNEEIKKIRITRAHLEEDAGKSIHDSSLGKSKIDLNRAGTPLLEIVSEPDMRSAAEASSYMKYVHLLVTYLGICDGNLQEGSLRCDANVSVKPRESKKLGTRTEIKNLNSFRFIEKAIEIEAQRQIEILESGGTITQETRLFDEEKQETRPMRSKEEANDYRYFPDPDLLPVVISEDLIKSIQQSMPELPNQKNKRFINEYQLDKNDAARIANDFDLATFFESSITHSKHASPKQLANWLLGKLLNMVNEKNINFSKLELSPFDVSSVVDLYVLGNLSQKQAGELLEYKHGSEASIEDLIAKHNMSQISDTQELSDLVDKILIENQVQFDEFKSGNNKVIGYLIGKVMQASKGKANPKLVKEIIESK